MATLRSPASTLESGENHHDRAIFWNVGASIVFRLLPTTNWKEIGRIVDRYTPPETAPMSMAIPPVSVRPQAAPEAREAPGPDRDGDADDARAAAARAPAPAPAGTGRVVDKTA